MISLTLRFDETVFPRIEGQEAGRFLLAMIYYNLSAEDIAGKL